jgi:hypothetical protein
LKSFDLIINRFLSSLLKELPIDTKLIKSNNTFIFSYQQHTCKTQFFKSKPDCDFKGIQFPIDIVYSQQNKLIALIQSKLHYTTTVYARNCVAKKIESAIAKQFLDTYHLMNSAKAAFQYGLFDTGELVAVASFSKGRKMNRLNENERSFELIRFCCKEGISVSGGISKLMSSFIHDKQPGDIMTYVDKQFSNGKSYYSCGFIKHSETEPHVFMVNTETMERSIFSESEFKPELYYQSINCGNIKLVKRLEYKIT